MHVQCGASRPVLVIAAAVTTAVACLAPLTVHAQSSAEFVPVTDAMLQRPAPGDWLMWRRTLDSWGYSPLDQVTRENVADLRMVWTRALASGRQEGTPLVYDGVMYMPQASDVIEAIDAVTGDLIWAHRRDLPDDVYEYVGGNARNNRNIAIYDRFIINTSDDDYVFGLDATTGEIAWETQIFDYKVTPAGHSSGPIIADGKVISGRSCRPAGGPDSCVILAHDARTGAELWRRHTIPKPGEPGDETWGGVPWDERLHVGTWMPASYDPELRLIYQGTSVTSPAPKFMLGGIDNTHLYHNSTLALDVDTGDIRWYYQHLNDHWDLDHPFERILVDTAVAPDPSAVSWINPRLEPGEVRKVMTGIPGKTGVVYTLDRETGEFLWATPTVTQNVISHIDGATGAVSENAEVVFTALGQEVFTCPTWNGGKDWEAGAYSPLTNTMYMPLRNTCARMMATTTFPEDTPVARTESRSTTYAIAYRHQLAPGTENAGTVRAISAETGETIWLFEQRAATMSLVATGGGLVFGGDVNGRFRAFDQDTGEVLWEINIGSPVTGFPISYAVGGRQYVAVSTGSGGTASHFMGLTPELRPSSGNNLFVFALPERD
ncbi:MAG: PQQ-binding-like beta-propeller repeat protein [Acidobacteria bacterium]|nr:PQQ-binding-like beta-propeller repeat protein [Acidobacteriota bacterium]